MKLFIYGVKDDVACDFIFFFQAINDGMMKRAVKGSLLMKETNAFNHDIKDKSVYQLGEIETLTGEIKPSLPVFCLRVSEARMELINEIKLAKAEAGEKEPDASEVVDDE